MKPIKKMNLSFITTLTAIFFLPLINFKSYLGPIPISAELFFIPAIIISVAIDYKNKKEIFNKNKYKLLLSLFSFYLFVMLISLVKVVNITSAILEILRYLSYVFLFFALYKVKFSQGQYIKFVSTFFISVLIVFSYGIFQYILDLNLNMAGTYALSEAKGRVYSTLVNPNYYAGFINFILPSLLLASIILFKRWQTKVLILMTFYLGLVNLIFTYTRSAWLVGAVTFILMLIFYRKFLVNLVRQPLIIVLLITMGISLLFLPDVQSRIYSAVYGTLSILQLEEGVDKERNAGNVDENTGNEDGNSGNVDGNNGNEDENTGNVNENTGIEDEKDKVKNVTNHAIASRTLLWKTGLYMFKENIILGVGQGNYLDRYNEYVKKYPELDMGHEAYSVHNSFIKVMAETGIIGLLSFLSIYIYLFIVTIKKCLSKEPIIQLAAFSLLFGSITFMVQNLSNNLIYIPQMNTIFWLVVALTLNFILSYNKASAMENTQLTSTKA
jgi:putative inorganic carbon (hco3(-)) transporter